MVSVPVLEYLKIAFEYFLGLAREQFWLPVLIVFVLLLGAMIYLAVIMVKAVSHVKRLPRLLGYLRRWYIALPTALAVPCALLGSVAAVTYVRGTALPVPSLSNVQSVFGEDQVLQWNLPVTADRGNLMFEIQSSVDANFPASKVQTILLSDTVYPLVAARNETLYWRVRAFEPGRNAARDRFGAWTKPVRIEQYVSVLEKIRRTHRLTVAMENEFGRSKFRWIEQLSEQDRERDMLGRAVAYKGVEVEIAYAIADELCRTHLAGRIDAKGGDRRPLACLPARTLTPPEDKSYCSENRCVSIEVQFAPVGWPDVMVETGKGNYDIAISTITYDPDRESDYRILFGAVSYEVTDHALVSKGAGGGDRASGGARVLTHDQAILSKTVAVQPETTSHKCMEWLAQRAVSAKGQNKKPQIAKQSRDVVALNMLMRGKGNFDAVVTDGAFADGWEELYGDGISVAHLAPELFGEEAPEYCRRQEYRTAVKAGEFDLQELADHVIAHLKETGELKRVKEQCAAEFRHYASRLTDQARAHPVQQNPASSTALDR